MNIISIPEGDTSSSLFTLHLTCSISISMKQILENIGMYCMVIFTLRRFCVVVVFDNFKLLFRYGDLAILDILV